MPIVEEVSVVITFKMGTKDIRPRELKDVTLTTKMSDEKSLQ